MSNKSLRVGAFGLERGREWLGGFLRLRLGGGGLSLAEKIGGCGGARGCVWDLNMQLVFSSLVLLTLSVLF